MRCSVEVRAGVENTLTSRDHAGSVIAGGAVTDCLQVVTERHGKSLASRPSRPGFLLRNNDAAHKHHCVMADAATPGPHGIHKHLLRSRQS